MPGNSPAVEYANGWCHNSGPPGKNGLPRSAIEHTIKHTRFLRIPAMTIMMIMMEMIDRDYDYDFDDLCIDIFIYIGYFYVLSDLDKFDFLPVAFITFSSLKS